MYVPQNGDEGMVLLLAAFRDYIVADPTIKELLPPDGGFVPEGFLTNETPTPFVMPAVIGDGKSEYGIDAQLVRLLVYVGDQGRGYSRVERLLHRLRRRINDTQTALNFLTFPQTEPLKVLHIEAAGSSASASLPNWKSELRGLYVFLTVAGFPTAE